MCILGLRIRTIVFFLAVVGLVSSISTNVCGGTKAIGSSETSVNPIGDDWYPATFDWQVDSQAVWDFSRYISKPAGKDGFVRVIGDHFYVGKPARRIRFWGCNLSAYATAPTHEQADETVKLLVKFGFNAVRFTHMDALWNRDALIDWKNKDELEFNEESLERFFYLVSELKKNGIYVTLDGIHHFYFHLKKHRPLTPSMTGGKDLRDKGLPFLYVINELQEHHKAYLRKLFLTNNPYTGLALADDPVLLGVGMLNESMVSKRGASFRYKNIPSEYLEDFQRLWNEWNISKHTEKAIPLSELDIDESRRMEFWHWMQFKFMKELKEFYINDLRIKCPIATTNAFAYTTDWASAALSDFTDGHGYFAHRSKRTIDRNNGKTESVWAFAKNYNWLEYMLSQRIGYAPYIIGEWNACFPARERYFGPLAVVALASRQDWDGAFVFTLSQGNLKKERLGHFSIYNDPSRMANMIPAAIAWHEGSIPKAEQSYRVISDPKFLLDTVGSSRRIFTEGLFLFRLFNVPEVKGIQSPPAGMPSVDYLGNFPEEAMARAIKECPIENRLAKEGLFFVRTNKMEVISGRLDGKTLQGKWLSIKAPPGNEYSITLVPLDEQDIRSSKRLLLTIGPVCLPKGLRYGYIKKDNLTYEDGTRSDLSLIKPFCGQVKIQNVRRLKCYMLDSGGQKTKQINVKYENGENSFTLDNDNQSLWYLLTAE